jgi:hypothetical protein
MLDQILISGVTGTLLLSGLGLTPLAVPTAASGGCEDTWAVKINEFLPNPAGADGTVLEEWVELYNTGDRQVQLDGWFLEMGTSSYSGSIDIYGSIPAGGTFVIKEAYADVNGDYVLPSNQKLNLGNASSNADALRLVDCDGIIADTVIYGGDNEDGWLDDRGFTVPDDETAPKATSDESLARTIDGVDSQISSNDFCDDGSPSPGALNDCEDEDTGGEDTGEGSQTEDFVACDSDLRINEFVPNPEGDDSGSEWVELYNTGTSSVFLDGWSLEWGTKSFSNDELLSGGEVPAGGHYVLGDELVLNADGLATLSFGNASSSGDGLRLLCPDGSVADTVIYGPNNDDAWIDDSGEEATSLASKPGSGTCIARIQDGYDTDASATDFQLLSAEECTLGEENPFTEPMVCTPGSAIRINEFLPDPNGTDDQHEWVELVSMESDSLRIDGWSIEIAKSSWGHQFSFPAGSEIDANGFLLIGGNEVVDIDFLAEDLDLGNAGSNGDGIRLVDCEGKIIDTVIYGLNNDDALEDDSGGIAISTAAIPDDDQSAGRFPDGADSDASGDDFAICLTPTPGAPNGNCAEDGGNGGGKDGKGPGGCRCFGDGPSGEGDPSSQGDPNADGCSQAGRSYSSMWGFLGLVILLRRRR